MRAHILLMYLSLFLTYLWQAKDEMIRYIRFTLLGNREKQAYSRSGVRYQLTDILFQVPETFYSSWNSLSKCNIKKVMEQFCYLSDMSKKYNMNSVVDSSHFIWLWDRKWMKCQTAMRFSYFKSNHLLPAIWLWCLVTGTLIQEQLNYSEFPYTP